MKTTLITICAMLFAQMVLFSQDSTDVVVKRTYTTKFLDGTASPAIDGLIDDPGWEIVEWEGDFIERRPDENTQPDHKTKFKIIYDEKFLYVGIRAYDSDPDKIEMRLSRRDGFQGDWVGIFIDSYHDKRSAFGFITTAAGVKADFFSSENGNNEDENWNPIWYTKTNIDSEGWTAEMKIPFSQLKFGKAKEQVWGIQVDRQYFRGEERYAWQRIKQDTPGFVSEFGLLDGLLNLEPQKQLEIQPYGVAKLETYEAEEGNPFRDGNDSQITGGLDAKIGITNDLTLDLTVNPDFGQVEADPSAIALDGFQIFFREQRPFFIENQNIFDYRISNSEAGNTFGSDNVFYSRRIGRSPQGFPNTADGEFVDQPENTAILGAAKFSGKTKNGWSIGVLESVTAKKYATIDNNGERRREVVEPLTNYFVGRLQKDFNDRNTFVGGIFTATNRDQLTPELDFLHKSAYSGGFDIKHQWQERDWYVGGNILFSHVIGGTEAIANTQQSIAHLFQRVGADHVSLETDRTSLTGTGGNIQLGKVGNGNWKFETGGTWRSPELELNDIGFQRQADDIRHYTWIGYQTLKPTKTFRRVGINYNHWSVWDFGGNHNSLRFNTNSWQNWDNNWFTNVGFNYEPKQFSNFALRGGPRLRLSPEIGFWNGYNTDRRKKVRFNVFHSGSKGVDNSYSFYNIDFGVTYQPFNALSISANPGYSINMDKLQYIDNIEANGNTTYLNGTVDQRTFSMSLRLNYTINPNLTIQYWGQPFISRGRYSDFKEVTDPLAKTFENRILTYSPNQISFEEGTYSVDRNLDATTDFSFGDPDFSFVQFRSNLVVRWEYIPGSEIFLVWSQDLAQSGNPQNELFNDLSDNIFNDQKPQNIFLIKATYRFVL
ncbi:carbohydrate binding family 9 domain-containing protein [Aggregatimonas sangjinii]|uniref:Carbohydrate binding family 9 domain-containing protein n=1 Tax=Aggregatimonas sangjinii TaxID=2583587 RepID=A0A5B7SXT2_9FLAO|nr:DUF5916 domain-containing protein [Aggregatimonas sangjinii]QCX01691.1 carbohydrate binding family 9 domain-containing protein [Aggregatimonas sangjinii]